MSQMRTEKLLLYVVCVFSIINTEGYVSFDITYPKDGGEYAPQDLIFVGKPVGFTIGFNSNVECELLGDEFSYSFVIDSGTYVRLCRDEGLLPAGLYTLRVVVRSMDGHHLNTSAIRLTVKPSGGIALSTFRSDVLWGIRSPPYITLSGVVSDFVSEMSSLMDGMEEENQPSSHEPSQEDVTDDADVDGLERLVFVCYSNNNHNDGRRYCSKFNGASILDSATTACGTALWVSAVPILDTGPGTYTVSAGFSHNSQGDAVTVNIVKPPLYYDPPNEEIQGGALVLSLFLGHDANICLCLGSTVLVVLQMERWTNKRYDGFFDGAHEFFSPGGDEFKFKLKKMVDVLFKQADFSVQRVHYAVFVSSSLPSDFNSLEVGLRFAVDADKWLVLDHHRSHATLGFYDSPFDDALVVSYDGFGNDGSFNVYTATRPFGLELKEGNWTQLNLGMPYLDAGFFIKEFEGDNGLTFPGKIMAYETLGTPQPRMQSVLRNAYTNSGFRLMAGNRDLGVSVDGFFSETDGRNWAASTQREFENVFFEHLDRIVLLYGQTVNGLVLTGGCALNVKVNEIVRRRYGLPVHVPAAPNDEGLSVGGAWSVMAPRMPQSITYSGMHLWDISDLQLWIQCRNAYEVTPDAIADLLVRGKMGAILRGRQEFGPRALGHRSLVAYPHADVKERVNRVKVRAWYRPVAPVVPEEDTEMFFGEHLRSPYMSFAPSFKPELRDMFKSVAHLDGTARVQTVSEFDEPWLHELLKRVGDRTGYPIIANSSFNVKGKPMVNTIEEALRLMDELVDVDFVVVEDYLFVPNRLGDR